MLTESSSGAPRRCGRLVTPKLACGRPGVLARDAGVHLAGHVDAVERAHEGGRDAGRMALLEEDVLHARGRGAADAQNAGAAGLDDGGLLTRDSLQGVAEDARVVKADAGDGHAADGLHGRGGVPAAAHAALQNGHVDAGLGKDHGGGPRSSVVRNSVTS